MVRLDSANVRAVPCGRARPAGWPSDQSLAARAQHVRKGGEVLMESKEAQQPDGAATPVSRRTFLAGVAAVAAAQSVSLASVSRAETEDHNHQGGHENGGGLLAYVGTYTPNGQGIHLFGGDQGSGALTPIKVFPSTVNPSWLAFDPGHKFLYAGNEIANFNGTTTGSVSAYAVNQTTGDLTLLNTVTSGGAGPAHVSVDPSSKFAFVANYGGGNVAVLPINPDGSLGNPTDVKADNSACSPACPVGPIHAQKAPPGNFVIVNDLGLDLTQVWK